MEYQEAKKQIQPLDLILFRGGDLVSKTIRMLEHLETGQGDWSHVGLVVTTDAIPTIKNAIPNKLYIWESTLSGRLNGDINDVESNQTIFGVQLRALDDLIVEYNKDDNTAIAWAKLENNPYKRKKDEDLTVYEARLAKLKDTLCALHQKYYHETYQLNPIYLLAAIFPWFRRFRKIVTIGKEWMFCSELASTVYCDIGVLNRDEVDPENVLPVDFIGDADNEFKPVNAPPIRLLPPHPLVVV